MRTIILSLCLGLALTSTVCAGAKDAANVDFFETKVRPVLVEHCYECHAGPKARGGLALDSREAMLLGGDNGPAIVPGKSDDSLLIRSIRHTNPDLKMPKKKAKLDDAVIADFVRWVNVGAPFPAKLVRNDDPKSLDWWSLKPIVRPAIPKTLTPDPSPRGRGEGWASSFEKTVLYGNSI